MIAFVRRCDNLECKGGKGGMRQKVYKTRKGKEGMLQFVPNTSACKAIPKSVLLIDPSGLRKGGLRLRHPVGDKKFGQDITEEDVRTWHKKQKFPMLCSKSKGRRYACAHIPTYTHTHTHTHTYTHTQVYGMGVVCAQTSPCAFTLFSYLVYKYAI